MKSAAETKDPDPSLKKAELEPGISFISTSGISFISISGANQPLPVFHSIMNLSLSAIPSSPRPWYPQKWSPLLAPQIRSSVPLTLNLMSLILSDSKVRAVKQSPVMTSYMLVSLFGRGSLQWRNDEPFKSIL